jgi:hypothetical protein
MPDSPPPSWVHRDKMSGLRCTLDIDQPDPKKKTTSNFNPPERKATLAEGRVWLRKLSLSTQILGKAFKPILLSDDSDIEEITKEEYLRCKPLPALPSPSSDDQDFYFEYLFADAGVTKRLYDDLNSPVELAREYPGEDFPSLSVKNCG